MDCTNIRSMQVGDLESIVQIHLDAFPHFFLTFLGPAFLSKLYLCILYDKSGIAFVYAPDSRIVGFVVGTDQPSGFYHRVLRRHWWRFGLASISSVIKQPMIIPRLLRAFSSPYQFQAPQGSGTLMSIAVNPDAQGSGVGQILLHAFMKEASCRGLSMINLTTDRCENDRVNRFYRKAGFTLSRTLTTHEGREMNEYSIKLH
jgi:ribosomal protein S18 acetylase RimI-like enzyme